MKPDRTELLNRVTDTLAGIDGVLIENEKAKRARSRATVARNVEALMASACKETWCNDGDCECRGLEERVDVPLIAPRERAILYPMFAARREASRSGHKGWNREVREWQRTYLPEHDPYPDPQPEPEVVWRSAVAQSVDLRSIQFQFTIRDGQVIFRHQDGNRFPVHREGHAPGLIDLSRETE